MCTAAEFFARLEGAGPDGWETEYVREPVELDRAAIREVLLAQRPFAEWLALRFEAGEPGVPLPDSQDALLAVMSGREGTPADAFTMMMVPSGLVDMQLDDQRVVICNSAGSALSAGTTWFAMWLLTRAGLASIVTGDTEYAWRIHDNFGADPRLGEILALFSELRGKPSLEESHWTKTLICMIWPQLDVRALPTLNYPIVLAGAPLLTEFLTELESEGCAGLLRLARTFQPQIDEQILSYYGREPLVIELEERALGGVDSPFMIDELPGWFLHWAHAAMRCDRFRIARQAGRLLEQLGGYDPRLIGILVLPALRSNDLELLRAGFLEEPFPQTLDELSGVVATFSEGLANALIALAFGVHIDAERAPSFLMEHIGELERYTPTPGGIVEHIIQTTRQLFDEREEDLAGATPALAQILEEATHCANQLEAQGTQISQPDIERAVSSMHISPPSEGLLRAFRELELDEPALIRLLVALALRQATADIEGAEAQGYHGMFSMMASDAITGLPAGNLWGLRLRLLEDVLSQTTHPSIVAEALCDRADTLRALGIQEERARSIFEDLQRARFLSRRDGNLGLFARATSMLVNLSTRIDCVEGEDVISWCEGILTEAFDWVTEPRAIAMLLQARARLYRASDPGRAQDAYSEALELLPPAHPQWVEVVAERVDLWRRQGQLEEAVNRGQAALARVAPDREDVALLFVSTGAALVEWGQCDEGSMYLELAIRLSRGNNPSVQTHARYWRARAAMVGEDLETAREHLRFLEERREDVNVTTRIDISRLAAAFANLSGDADVRRQHLSRAASEALEEELRVGLLLEIALLDLESGRLFEDLELLERALQLELLEEHEDCVFAIVIGHELGLSDEILSNLSAWADARGRALFRAHLLERAGEREQALDLLRAQRDRTGMSLVERLDVLRWLMIWLPAGQEHRAICAEVEGMIDQVPGAGHVRLDLAEAFRAGAELDVSVLARARSHAVRALEELETTSAVAHAQGVLARISIQLLRAQLPISSPSCTAYVVFLADELAIEGDRSSHYRLSAAELLMVPGPALHPSALELASRLLERVEMSERGHLEGRLCWIEERRARDEGNEQCPVGEVFPLDALPWWLVNATCADEVTFEPAELARNLSSLRSVVYVRPDLADRLLAAAITSSENLSRAEQNEVIQVVLDAAQLASRHVECWPELSRAARALAFDADDDTRLFDALLSILEIDVPQAQNASFDQIPRFSLSRDFHRAVWLTNSCQGDHEANALEKARELLEGVVDRASAQFPEYLFDALVSLGNSFRKEPGMDIERALELYERADRLDADDRQRAKLDKVTADALLIRGSDEDLRRAEILLAQACAARDGRWLAETLVSRAQVARRYPDHEELEQARRATEFAMQAVRTHHALGDQDGMIELVRDYLSDWERLSPDSEITTRHREELCELYPNRARELQVSPARFSDREREELSLAYEHPAAREFVKVRVRFLPPNSNDGDLSLFERWVGATFIERAREHMRENSLWGNGDAARALLEELEQREVSDRTPGELAAQVVILAHLALLGEREVVAVKGATRVAYKAACQLEDVIVRCLLIRELALIWSPEDHQDNPVRDFSWASRMLLECVELDGGEENTTVDTLQALARAYRHTGNPGDLAKARRLYRYCVESGRAENSRDTLANILFNLAEIESHMGEGGRLANLLTSTELMEQAFETANTPALKMRLASGLAWQRTQVALRLEGQSMQRERLDEALELFREVDESVLSDVFLQSHRLHRRVCEGIRARLAGERQQEQQLWREYIELPGLERYLCAIGQHNLAESLLFGREYSRDELTEALRLLDNALKVRSEGGDHRHRWESAICAGNALLMTIMSRPEILPIPRDRALECLREYQRIGTEAALALGSGEELFDIARLGMGLALLEQDTRCALERLEWAWGVMSEASAFLLLEPSIWENEAQLALQTTMELARRFARVSRSRPPRGVSFILTDEPASIIGRWIARIQEPSRRYTRARLGRPSEVSPALWQRWREALRDGSSTQVMSCLAELRTLDARFLSAPTSNNATWRWLGARVGSVAISMHAYEDEALVFVMSKKGGRRKTFVLGLRLSSKPAIPKGASETRRSAARGQRIREALSRPIEQLLGRVPSVVLWSPGPGLRDIMPADIWGDVPVAVTTSLALPTFGTGRRERSILVSLADPGRSSNHPELGSHGAAALECFESIISAQDRGARLLASRGEVYGHALLGSRREVRDTPASARDLLKEAREHEVIVIIAHGVVESANSSSFLCIDARGREDHLDLEMLASEPESFAGATVILLSCESGRTGDTLFNPGGLAGTLIASGARCVIAPLIPVRLDLAVEVGTSVLTALHNGVDPWSVLAQIEPAMHGEERAPTMGGPPPSAGARRAEANGQRRSFVAWVG